MSWRPRKIPVKCTYLKSRCKPHLSLVQSQVRNLPRHGPQPKKKSAQVELDMSEMKENPTATGTAQEVISHAGQKVIITGLSRVRQQAAEYYRHVYSPLPTPKFGTNVETSTEDYDKTSKHTHSNEERYLSSGIENQYRALARAERVDRHF